LAKRYREVLDKLDPVAVARYQITEKDIRTIERYLKIIQANLIGGSLWQEIMDTPTPYATSLVIHELVEIRMLQSLGVNPLKLDTKTLQRMLEDHIEAHIQAVMDEHLYLQRYIAQEYKQFFQVGTLLKANRDDETERDRRQGDDITRASDPAFREGYVYRVLRGTEPRRSKEGYQGWNLSR